jgi:hypothetical protein
VTSRSDPQPCRFYPALLLALALPAFLGCESRCQVTTASADPLPPSQSRMSFRPLPLSPAERPLAHVQLLIDTSGSMEGFSSALPENISWIQRALGAFGGEHADISRSYRACEFNQSVGIASCSTDISTAYLPSQKVHGDTNLHKAIMSAADYDLTVILTDGVPSEGAGNGSCAAGVDSACMADAFARVIQQFQLQKPQGGIWMLPIVMPFKGRFYTEKKASASDFDVQGTESQVSRQVGRQISITSPTNEHSGELVYNYTGPRVAFLFVLARNAQAGRTLLFHLHRERQSVAREIQSMKDWDGGLDAFQSIEIFPALPPETPWAGLKIIKACGPSGPKWDQRESLLGLVCRKAAAKELVEIGLQTPEESGDTLTLELLAPPSLSLTAESPQQVRPDAEISWPTGLRLLVSCPFVDKSEEKLYVTAQANLGTAADCLVEAKKQNCRSRAAELIIELSTSDDASQPQLTLGLMRTLNDALHALQANAFPVNIASLEIHSLK